MQINRINFKHPFTISAAVTCLFLAGCATPSAIKTASKAQCELIGELDQSLQSLECGLVQFHEDSQEQIRQVGHVLIAKQAINAIVEAGGVPTTTNGTTTVDTLFENSNTKIRPFVDNAFFDAGRITQLTEAMNATTNDVLRNLLLAKVNALKRKRADLSAKPPAVADLESKMEEEIATLQKTERDIQAILDVVRAQASLMKVVATTIDAWLDQDVTITKAQADNLETAVINGQKGIGGGK